MMVLGSFKLSYEKILHAQKAQKAQNAHERIKTKTVLNAHKKHLRGRKSLSWYKSTKRT